jgi:hypothetical protein
VEPPKEPVKAQATVEPPKEPVKAQATVEPPKEPPKPQVTVEPPKEPPKNVEPEKAKDGEVEGYQLDTDKVMNKIKVGDEQDVKNLVDMLQQASEKVTLPDAAKQTERYQELEGRIADLEQSAKLEENKANQLYQQELRLGSSDDAQKQKKALGDLQATAIDARDKLKEQAMVESKRLDTYAREIVKPGSELYNQVKSHNQRADVIKKHLPDIENVAKDRLQELEKAKEPAIQKEVKAQEQEKPRNRGQDMEH